MPRSVVACTRRQASTFGELEADPCRASLRPLQSCVRRPCFRLSLERRHRRLLAEVRAARRSSVAAPSDCSGTRSRHLNYPPKIRLHIRFDTVRMAAPKLRPACEFRRSRKTVSVYADDCMFLAAAVGRRPFVWVLYMVPYSTLRLIISIKLKIGIGAQDRIQLRDLG
jgi:hypothetical protein